MSWATFTKKYAVVTGDEGELKITPNLNQTLQLEFSGSGQTVTVQSKELVEAVLTMAEESGWYHPKDES